MTPPIVALDTETTGVHPGRKVWEVAMIRRDDDRGHLAEISFMVEVDLRDADPFGLKVGGFYERHPHGQYLAGMDEDLVSTAEVVEVETAAERVAAWTHGAHVIGAVPNFDTEVLGTMLRDNGLTSAWHYHLIDVEGLAVGYLAGRRAEWSAATREPDEINPYPAPSLPWKSDDLSRACGVEPPSDEERHTALGDAKWALRLYDAITGGA